MVQTERGASDRSLDLYRGGRLQSFPSHPISLVVFCALYSFIFLYLVLSGPGEWSLDAQVRKRP